MRPGRLRRWRRLASGQAMLEYTWVAHAVLLGGAVAVWPFWRLLMGALDTYFQSVFFVLTSPVP